MSEHDLKELERQWQAAIDRRKAAQTAESEAWQRLQDARNEASGLMDHLVEFDFKAWNKPPTTYRFVVTNIVGAGESTRAVGKAVLKNGAVGVIKRDCYLNKLRDLGPYKAPAALTPTEGE